MMISDLGIYSERVLDDLRAFWRLIVKVDILSKFHRLRLKWIFTLYTFVWDSKPGNSFIR